MSIASYVCITGGSAPGWSPPATPSPVHSPPTVTLFSVKMVVMLPMSLASFTSEKQTSFRRSLASVAGVSVEEGKIEKIEGIINSRRLLPESIRVEASVKAQDKDMADTIAPKLTVERLNVELAKAGLPAASAEGEAELVSGCTDAECQSKEAESSKNDDIFTLKREHIPFLIIGGVGGGFTLLLAVIACMWRKHRRKRHPSSNPGPEAQVSDTGSDGDSHEWAQRAQARTSSAAATDDVAIHITQSPPISTRQQALGHQTLNMSRPDSPAAIEDLNPNVIRGDVFAPFRAAGDEVARRARRSARTSITMESALAGADVVPGHQERAAGKGQDQALGASTPADADSNSATNSSPMATPQRAGDTSAAIQCASCQALVKPEWPRCPGCKTPITKGGERWPTSLLWRDVAGVPSENVDDEAMAPHGTVEG